MATNQDIRDVAQALALYPGDIAGAILALERMGYSEAMRKLATSERKLADLLPASDERWECRLRSLKAAAVAASTREQVTIRARDLHDAAVAPRLSASGTPKAVWADPVSELARASAGAVQRFCSVVSYILTPEQRGRLYTYLRAQGVDIPYRKQRRQRSKKR
jgi:hypothetical protein